MLCELWMNQRILSPKNKTQNTNLIYLRNFSENVSISNIFRYFFVFFHTIYTFSFSFNTNKNETTKHCAYCTKCWLIVPKGFTLFEHFINWCCCYCSWILQMAIVKCFIGKTGKIDVMCVRHLYFFRILCSLHVLHFEVYRIFQGNAFWV